MYNRPSLMIPQLGSDPTSEFPDPATAMESPDGLLAWGGDLDPVRLNNAYHRGIFPWYSEDQPILWWSPATRCVIFPADVHISRRLQRLMVQGRFTLSADQAFESVMLGCAKPREDQEDTWITPAMIKAYCLLHRMGIAHSVEVWKDGELTGGIYGLVLGKIFFGESMFSASRDASKVALVSLCQQLDAWDFGLLDCQVSNPHLQSMGAVEIARETFLSILASNVNKNSSKLAFSEAFNGSS
jgi:leucyl/phenylalanyl-tRNA--protein transferase